MSLMKNIHNKFGYQRSKELVNGMYQKQLITESERGAMLDEIEAIEEVYLKRCRGVMLNMFNVSLMGGKPKEESKLLNASIYLLYFFMGFGVTYFLAIILIGAHS